jgi:ribosomal protein L34
MVKIVEYPFPLYYYVRSSKRSKHSYHGSVLNANTRYIKQPHGHYLRADTKRGRQYLEKRAS